MPTHAHLCVSIGDDGLGGYRDTEALGVVGARMRDDDYVPVKRPGVFVFVPPIVDFNERMVEGMRG